MSGAFIPASRLIHKHVLPKEMARDCGIKAGDERKAARRVRGRRRAEAWPNSGPLYFFAFAGSTAVRESESPGPPSPADPPETELGSESRAG